MLLTGGTVVTIAWIPELSNRRFPISGKLEKIVIFLCFPLAK